ncbi:DUF943 family protein [Kosakonia sp. H02]|nr:DUF943 family protein [Kosakonia sp. H02]
MLCPCLPRSLLLAADASRGLEKVTRQECCRILFDEFRHLSNPFTIYSPYRHLIRNQGITLMFSKRKMVFYALFLLGCMLGGYFLWLTLRPVEIVEIHQRRNFSDVLVNNFPLTDKAKINWWLKNKDRLKKEYGIPKPASYGNFTITFWLFGEGYKEEGKYDRLCFDDMKTKRNCIEKEAVFSVDWSKNLGLVFTVDDGAYQMTKNGDVVKLNK